MKYLIIILAVGVLCAGWVLVQILAKKLKTKNHFEHLNSSCGGCTCGGEGYACNADSKTTGE